MGKHLKEYERYLIETWLKEGVKPMEISRRLHKHYNTIYAEIRKGSVSQLINNWSGKTRLVYYADVAQRITVERGHNKGRDLKIGHDHALAAYIEHLIGDLHYSPYAVVQTIRRDSRFTTDICESTLYSYIDSGLFLHISNKDLYVKRNKRRKKKHDTVNRPCYHKPPEKSIEHRPASVDTRDTYGHWEMDTVYSGTHKSKSCLLVLTERKTLDEYLLKMPDRTYQSTVSALDKLERAIGAETFRNRFKSITVDNGVEFGDGSRIEHGADGHKRTAVYFCHPFASSERGSNENQNRLIRHWIRKGESIADYSTADIQRIQDWINNYPRRKFGGMSSNEYKASLGIV